MNSTSFYPVWSTLVYFDIFRYPLREDELVRFCHHEPLNRIEIRQTINELIKEGLVFKIGEYYSLKDEIELVLRREAGNSRAVKKWEKARTYSKMMSKFPFVRGVWISGSLSKDFMDENSDIDYFIITKADRLWISRTFMILFKKIFLLNSHKNFCVNYFIDENHLKIQDKNLFTATELLTLRPLTNESLYKKFLTANLWANQYLPGYRTTPFESLFELPISKFQKTTEFILEIFPLKFIDSIFLKITKNYWIKKFKTIDTDLRNQQMRSEKHISKHHPQGYQHKVMRLYEERLENSPEWLTQQEQNHISVI